jgi:hypothetical protein
VVIISLKRPVLCYGPCIRHGLFERHSASVTEYSIEYLSVTDYSSVIEYSGVTVYSSAIVYLSVTEYSIVMECSSVTVIRASQDIRDCVTFYY